jgi:hypothetical protein
MLTTNTADPKLNKIGTNGQMETYLILSDEERAKGYVRPVRKTYVHKKCGGVTKIFAREIAESFARDPKMYTHTFCCTCKDHLPVSEFIWQGTNILVGE